MTCKNCIFINFTAGKLMSETRILKYFIISTIKKINFSDKI